MEKPIDADRTIVAIILADASRSDQDGRSSLGEYTRIHGKYTIPIDFDRSIFPFAFATIRFPRTTVPNPAPKVYLLKVRAS
jgi:hypothetical protein